MIRDIEVDDGLWRLTLPSPGELLWLGPQLLADGIGYGNYYSLLNGQLCRFEYRNGSGWFIP